MISVNVKMCDMKPAPHLLICTSLVIVCNVFLCHIILLPVTLDLYIIDFMYLYFILDMYI